MLNGLTKSVTGMSATEAQLGNEPSFDIPWEYDYVGAPYKAEKVVRQVQNQLYTDTPHGLAGNDDLGAMSSWLVFSALGAYPETPGSAVTALGSPEFSQIAIHLGNGNTITESAPQAAKNAPYVQSMTRQRPGVEQRLPARQPVQAGRHGRLDARHHAEHVVRAPTPRPRRRRRTPRGSTRRWAASAARTGPARRCSTPGSSTTLTLGAQSLSSSSQTVNWTATTTSGSGDHDRAVERLDHRRA